MASARRATGAAAAYLKAFVEDVNASRFVARSIAPWRAGTLRGAVVGASGLRRRRETTPAASFWRRRARDMSLEVRIRTPHSRSHLSFLLRSASNGLGSALAGVLHHREPATMNTQFDLPQARSPETRTARRVDGTRCRLVRWRACLVLLSAFLFAGERRCGYAGRVKFAGGNGTGGEPVSDFHAGRVAPVHGNPVVGFFPNNAYYRLTRENQRVGHEHMARRRRVAAGGRDPDGRLRRPGTRDPESHHQSSGGRWRWFVQAGREHLLQEVKNIRIVGGQITGRDQVGGLGGSSDSAATITNSHSTATIAGRSDVGGLVGNSGNSPISGSSSGGTVTGTGDFVGGLVGRTGAEDRIGPCDRPWSPRKQVGGLIGVYVQGGAPALTSSWATGQVDGDDRVGGLIGDSQGKVTFSYATGAVTATGANPPCPGTPSRAACSEYRTTMEPRTATHRARCRGRSAASGADRQQRRSDPEKRDDRGPDGHGGASARSGRRTGRRQPGADHCEPLREDGQRARTVDAIGGLVG
ncbi:MAG: hypothetical protein IPI73_25060 [Betaproteobacteria bacterium]|nr:hypothetical protein [Betaproteobacteria bacterium]